MFVYKKILHISMCTIPHKAIWCCHLAPLLSLLCIAHNITPMMRCVHEPNNSFETKDFGCRTLVLQTKYEVRAIEHNRQKVIMMLNVRCIL